MTDVYLLLINPHTPSSPGCVAAYKDSIGDIKYLTEYEYCAALAKELKHLGTLWNLEIKYLEAPDNISYADRQQQLVEDLKYYRPMVALEVHFNWLSEQVFRPDHWLWESTTALINYNNEDAEALATKLVSAVSEVVGTISQKIQSQVVSWEATKKNANDRWVPAGGEITTLVHAPRGTLAIYLETHVGNNVAINTKAVSSYKDLARAILDTLRGIK